MLKLITSFGLKVPSDEAYSSRSYHASVESELSDGLTEKEIRERIHQRFALVESSVKAELSGVVAEDKATGISETAAPADPEKITNRQAKFIFDLARQRGLSLADVNNKARSEFQADSVYALGKKSASKMVELLKAA